MTTETPLTVTYRPEPDDLRATHRATIRARGRRFSVYTAILFMVTCTGHSWLIGYAWSISPSLALASGAVLGLFLAWLLHWSAEYRVVRAGAAIGMFEEQSLTIGPQGFRHAFTDGRESAYPWRKVRKVGQSPTDFVIVIDGNYGVNVPLHAFRSHEFARDFIGSAIRWHAQEAGRGL